MLIADPATTRSWLGNEWNLGINTKWLPNIRECKAHQAAMRKPCLSRPCIAGSVSLHNSYRQVLRATKRTSLTLLGLAQLPARHLMTYSCEFSVAAALLGSSSLVTTQDPHLHNRLRQQMNPFLTAEAIQRQMPAIHSKVQVSILYPRQCSSLRVQAGCHAIELSVCCTSPELNYHASTVQVLLGFRQFTAGYWDHVCWC